jgi:hypothetical protein
MISNWKLSFGHSVNHDPYLEDVMYFAHSTKHDRFLEVALFSPKQM